MRLTDAVIAQLKQAGEHQRDSFDRVLRDVLDARGGEMRRRHGDLDGDGAPASSGDVMASIREEVATESMDCDDAMALGGTQSDGRQDSTVSPEHVGGSLDESQGRPPHAIGDETQADRALARSTAARQRMEAIKERVQNKRAASSSIHTESEVPEAVMRRMRALRERIAARSISEPANAASDAVDGADGDRTSDGRPTKTRRTLGPRGGGDAAHTGEGDAPSMSAPQSEMHRGSVHDHGHQASAHDTTVNSVAATNGAYDTPAIGNSGISACPNGDNVDGMDYERIGAVHEPPHPVHADVTSIGSLSTCLREPLNAARERLLRQLRGQHRLSSPLDAPTRAKAARPSAGSAARHATSQAGGQFDARGLKRGATSAGAAASSEFGNECKRRRLRGKQPPKRGIG